MSAEPRPSSSARGRRSSPSTWATLTSRPSEPASRRSRSASPAGLSPPALVTILTPLVDGEAERFLHLAQERLGVAQLRVLGAVPAEDEHRQLGEVVTGEDVELAAGEHLAHGGEAVAVEARGVADSQRSPATQAVAGRSPARAGRCVVASLAGAPAFARHAGTSGRSFASAHSLAVETAGFT